MNITTVDFEDYQLIKNLDLVAPSTISGWRKSGEHPKWVDQIYRMDDFIQKLMADKADLEYKYKVACHFGQAAAHAAGNPLAKWNLIEAIQDAQKAAKS